MVTLKKFLRWAFYAINFIFSLWVFTGGYRRATVRSYLFLENFYDGSMRFAELVMMCEVAFLLLFAAYVFTWIFFIFRKNLATVKTFDKVFWGVFMVYLLFFLMIHELYS